MLTDDAQRAFRTIVNRDPGEAFVVVAIAISQMTGIREEHREFLLLNILHALECQRSTVR
jgi:hypothetical protein